MDTHKAIAELARLGRRHARAMPPRPSSICSNFITSARHRGLEGVPSFLAGDAENSLGSAAIGRRLRTAVGDCRGRGESGRVARPRRGVSWTNFGFRMTLPGGPRPSDQSLK